MLPKINITLPEDVRIKFKSYINSRTGLYFKDYDLKDLDNVICGRMKERSIGTPAAYYNYLTLSEQREDELRELLNRLTINHTYFFRNEPHFKALKDKILPEMVDRKVREARDLGLNKPALRIWSAGCSSGEEPYTIAMVLKSAIPDIEKWDIHILATDASMAAIGKATKGVYSINSVKLVDRSHLSMYFTQKPNSSFDEKYEINPEIRKMVSFGFFNLMDEDYPGGFDLIFCRNVTIYFETETTAKVIAKFEKSLDKEGFLFIGYSETLQYISDDFKMLEWNDAIYYAKEKAHRIAAEQPAPFDAPGPSFKRKPDMAVPVFEFNETARVETSGKVRRSQEFENAVSRAVRAVYMKNYELARSIIKEASELDSKDPEPYYLEAEVNINQGRLDDARESLSKALAKDVMFAPAYYLFGTIYEEEGSVEEAEKSFKKALYLEKEFSLAHLALANIHRVKGRIDAALREYRNTLTVLSKFRPYDIIAYSGGFNAATLSSVCKNSIELIKAA